MRQVLRVRHYAPRTEECYVPWAERFIRFHGKRHPAQLGAAEVSAFLTELAVNRRVAGSTQNQAFNALILLYHQVLEIDLGRIDAVRAQRGHRLPVVLSVEEVRRTREAIRAGSDGRPLAERRRVDQLDIDEQVAVVALLQRRLAERGENGRRPQWSRPGASSPLASASR